MISFEDFAEDIWNGEDWTYECFGSGGECSGLLLEATRPGFDEDDTNAGGMAEYAGELWVQYKGKKKNVHIGIYQD